MEKKFVKNLIAICGVLTIVPMWLFLLHEILEFIQADRLLWFIYWVYLPLSILLGIINAIVDNMED